MTDKQQKSRYTRASNFLEDLSTLPSGSFGKCLSKVVIKPTIWRDTFEINNIKMDFEDAVRYLAFDEQPITRINQN